MGSKAVVKGRGGGRGVRPGRGAELDVESMEVGEAVCGPGGCRVVKTSGGDVCPAE